MNETPFYVEFAVRDSERFNLLKRVFNELKRSKDITSFHEDDYYLNFFDEKAKSHFRWSFEESENTSDIQKEWDFGSIIEAFKNGEYELLSCEMVSTDKARITYDPWSYPFGGTGCMRALAESFGCEVTKEDWAE